MLSIDAINAVRASLPGMDLAGAVPNLRNAAELEQLGGATAGNLAPRPVQPLESFSSMLDGLVTEVNTKQQQAKSVVQNLQTGGNVPIHQAVIAMEEASVSFQLMVEVRNKMLEAYTEIMRMQV